ncbi:hypothetical protein STEG23_000539, partial [Scotinomys teguina]
RFDEPGFVYDAFISQIKTKKMHEYWFWILQSRHKLACVCCLILLENLGKEIMRWNAKDTAVGVRYSIHGEVAHWVKCLLPKHEDLVLDPQDPSTAECDCACLIPVLL